VIRPTIAVVPGRDFMSEQLYQLTTLPGQGLADVKLFPKAKSLMKQAK
jgi:hypothetical protein